MNAEVENGKPMICGKAVSDFERKWQNAYPAGQVKVDDDDGLDLWEKLRTTLPQRPEKSFTIAEFAAHFSLPKRTANKRVTELEEANKVKRVEVGGKTYFVWAGA